MKHDDHTKPNFPEKLISHWVLHFCLARLHFSKVFKVITAEEISSDWSALFLYNTKGYYQLLSPVTTHFTKFIYNPKAGKPVTIFNPKYSTL